MQLNKNKIMSLMELVFFEGVLFRVRMGVCGNNYSMLQQVYY